MTKFFRICSIAAVASAWCAPASGAPVLNDGHADIRVTYTGGQLDIFYRTDEGGVVNGNTLSEVTDYQPNALTPLIPNAPVARPAGASWDFTGTAAGQPLWYIGQTQEVGKPWLGVSTESVLGSDFSSIAYRLTNFSGPGHLSLTSTGTFGGNTVYWQTSDGLSAADQVSVSAGVHAHYNWYLTAPGLYTYDITAIGTRTPAAGGGTVQITDTFSIQVVPEPASAGLLSGVAVMGLLRRRRRVR